MEQKALNLRDTTQVEGIVGEVRDLLRLRHYSRKTERCYVSWCEQYLLYCQHKQLALSAESLKNFLTNLAKVRMVSASTQNQAFSALLLLFRGVLHIPLEGMEKVVRAKQSKHLPVVLSGSEFLSVLKCLGSEYQLPAKLGFGAGLRLMEILSLRVKDIDFAFGIINIHDPKGGNGRVTLLPQSLVEELRSQIQQVRSVFEADVRCGFGGAFMPEGLRRKFPRAPFELAWQYLFPSRNLIQDPESGLMKRGHLYHKSFQIAFCS